MESTQREFDQWRAMVRSAYNVTDRNYSKVGGKGLGVYKPWRESFDNFLRDVGPCPSGKFLQRKDESQPFHPGNVEWA
jgi:hypothetical protein